MLQQARVKQQGSSINYIERDICEWMPDQNYDLIFSTYIYNYAGSEQRLAAMIHPMAQALKAGGKLVVVQDIIGFRSARDYPETFSHFQIHHLEPVQPYEQFRLTLKGAVGKGAVGKGAVGSTTVVDIYPNSIELADLENQLQAHGFSDICFIPPAFHPDIWQKMPSRDLRNLSCFPWFVIITATRDSSNL